MLLAGDSILLQPDGSFEAALVSSSLESENNAVADWQIDSAALETPTIVVTSALELQNALALGSDLLPGTTILIGPGEYESIGRRWHVDFVHGTEEAPITIKGANPDDPPVFTGAWGWWVEHSSHLILSNFVIHDIEHDNGLYLHAASDSVSFDELSPSHHIVVENLVFQDIGGLWGSPDALKMLYTDYFTVRNCHFERWSNAESAIDALGCQHGVIEGNVFTGNQGGTGVGMKGGSNHISVQGNYFYEAGDKAIRVGGTSGQQYFRDPVGSTLADGTVVDYEAVNIEIAGNRIVCKGTQGIGVMWASSKGGWMHQNTIVSEMGWGDNVIEILEYADPPILGAHSGVITDNLFVFVNTRLSDVVQSNEGAFPETFAFDHNAWFHLERELTPEDIYIHTPDGILALNETNGVYGLDPQLDSLCSPAMRIHSSNPVFDGIGADAWPDEPSIWDPMIVDDGGAGFVATGGWVVVEGEGFQSDVRQSAEGLGENVATWTFPVAPGTYRVSATWQPHPDGATKAPFTILDGSVVTARVKVNQQAPPDDFSAQDTLWEDLGVVKVTGDRLEVRLSNDTRGLVRADAIRCQRVATVVARHVFYNDSVFDGNDPAADSRDDGAIGIDKAVLLPGQSASFENYTSYCHGINGIMVDIAGLDRSDQIGADDFRFYVGNSQDKGDWLPAPSPASVTVRPGAGVDGSDRVTIIWANDTIEHEWLEVAVMPTSDTRLPWPDFFYVGNTLGESGNSTDDARVNATDMLLARNNQRGFPDPAPIDFALDFNRDTKVDATDMLIARNNQTHFISALQLISAPEVADQKAAFAMAAAAESAVASHATGAQESSAADVKQYEANQPIGEAMGLHPGRVTWVHDPDATAWDGYGPDYWWEDINNDQTVIDEMISKAVRWQAGEYDDAAAWDAIFRHFNLTHEGEALGYTPGERIAIKVNLNNAKSHTDADNGIDASPQLVLALIRQLVNRAGVDPGDITLYDSVRWIPDKMYIPIHAEFPGVLFVDSAGGSGRLLVQRDTDPDNLLYLSGGRGGTISLPTCVTEAKYILNVANLKIHERAGMTGCAKNHFGTIELPYRLHDDVDADVPLGSYNPLVDLTAHKHLGGKTLLYVVDGLYGGFASSGTPRRWETFGNDWPSSLFISQDPVAIDSVAMDFLRAEKTLKEGTENYLHEAALADSPPSGTTYDSNHDGAPLVSLGVHEHWDNATDKQYSRNLGTGEGIELISQQPVASASVKARHTFYNGSVFDGGNPTANAGDDEAIASDKQALLPGQTATYQNYTCYNCGINGVIVDVANLPPAAEPLRVEDYFQFKVGNNETLADWDSAPTPVEITVRPGEGVGGSDRVTVVWADRTITGQWLQISVLATAQTGLPEADVFYFGNAIGEAGNSTADAHVNATDMLLARNNPRNFLDPAPIDLPYDFNRDARVNAIDMLLARNGQTDFSNALQLITAPGGKNASGDAATSEPMAVPDRTLQETGDGELSRATIPAAGLDWIYALASNHGRSRGSATGNSAEKATLPPHSDDEGPY
ncbi:MAG: DUF362 domain-containing protein [Pirellulales bacterium]|nr:DUF362 domain-containing protein [Pirellulales bacterium]